MPSFIYRQTTVLGITLGLLGACAKPTAKTGFEGGAAQQNTTKTEEDSTASSPEGPATPEGEGSSADNPMIETKLPDGRVIEDVLCQDGRKILNLIEKTYFFTQFDQPCGPTTTTALFKELVGGAYLGQGEPSVKLLGSQTNDLFVTRMTIAFAIRAPIADPSSFYSFKAHDILANGIKEQNNEVRATVESRETFPGRRSVEQIFLNYSLKKSEGGGLYDRRRTAFNTYLLQEDRTDVVLSTEELVDADSNEYYHDYKGLLLGVKDKDGATYLVFLNDMTIKNRIDPVRLQRTLLALNGGMQKIMLNFFKTKTAAP